MMRANPTSDMSDALLRAVVRELVMLEDLASEVKRNYTQNRWWPTTVTDWRLRMLLAGWTTRVSYTSINHYQTLVQRASEIGYDSLCAMPDRQVAALTQAIGLPEARRTYLRSLAKFLLRNSQEFILSGDTDQVISAFAESVSGAGFKVAQCALLYAKGYHCGLIPIDSGMCEMLAPAIPVPYPHSGPGHEIVRRRIQDFATRNTLFLKKQIGSPLYQSLVPPLSTPTWWLHLLLIYYKRLYWNRGRSHIFPRDGKYTNTPPATQVCPNPQRLPYILIEGTDAGTSAFASLLAKHGYAHRRCRCMPAKKKGRLLSLQEKMIAGLNSPTVISGSLLSELAYARILRNRSPLDSTALQHLLLMMKDKGFVAVFLTDYPANIERRHGRDPNLRALLKEYRALFDTTRRILPAYWLNSATLRPELFPALFSAS